MDGIQNDSGGQFIIRVYGKLNPNWEDYFEGFSIDTHGEQIVLTGEVVDHSDLIGLIDKLNMLDLKLDSLERVIIPIDDKANKKGK